MANLLLIDDDEDDREFFLSSIASINPALRCEVAWNGKVALERLISGYRPDLIFLDLNMPIMSGKQFLTELSKNAGLASIPVVVLSTSVDQSTIQETKQLGAAHFMTKPNKLSALEAALRKVFDDFLRKK